MPTTFTLLVWVIGWGIKMKFRKKPIIIEAVQWTGENIKEIKVFTNGKTKYEESTGGSEDGGGYPQIYARLIIPTLEGDHKANIGDWIIKGIKGEFYPIKNEIFLETYEKM